MWKPQRVSSQRHPPRRLRPPARSALWHTAYFLPPRCAWRSRKSSGRPPSRRTRCRRARPHDTLILCHGPAGHRGYDQAAPHALLERAARRLDQAGAGRTASPSEATPSRQLRDTTCCGDLYLMRNEFVRFYHHHARQCMPLQKLRREIQ